MNRKIRDIGFQAGVFILLEAVFVLPLSSAGSLKHAENNNTLSAHINIGSVNFLHVFNQAQAGSRWDRDDYALVLRNAAELMTAESIEDVERIMNEVIKFLGYSRAKLYEVVDHKQETNEWCIKEQLKLSNGSWHGASRRYVHQEGKAADEKEWVLNRAQRTDESLIVIGNRWEHIIGDVGVKEPFVDPELIANDVQTRGDGHPDRVMQYGFLVMRNSMG
ncbi:MAG: hypothetical protein KKH34_11900 [Candidatus Omnitrophica bacterium]|nr:hypothetical protein [Candidatus Omnitrophota bacterium]